MSRKWFIMFIMMVMSATVSFGAKEEFKDASADINTAANDFAARGVLKEFIGKYGKTYFRPTTTITREELLLTLHEYDRVIKMLIESRNQLSTSVTTLKNRIGKVEKSPSDKKSETTELNAKQLDIIVRNVKDKIPQIIDEAGIPIPVQNQFDALNRKINAMEAKIPKGRDVSDTPATSVQYNKLIKEIKELEKKISSIEATPVSALGSSGDTRAQINKLIKKISNLETKIDNVEEASLQNADGESISESRISRIVRSEIKKEIKRERPQEVSSQAQPERSYLTKLTIGLGMLAAVFLAR